MARKRKLRKKAMKIDSAYDPVKYPGEYYYWDEWNNNYRSPVWHGDKTKIKAPSYANNLKNPYKESTFVSQFTTTYRYEPYKGITGSYIRERKDWGWKSWTDTRYKELHENNQKQKMLLERREAMRTKRER